ncbi:ferredoxin-type protein NapF [Photobacterium kishitanii]|uniref:ferredoxin-type protein NapF n=1 Tax=Photobacterium kishitanii TaxID=318456 RepID=UPI000D162CBB|nr:ferredoxin-type protein NapF [Photobacterium kishitanii]PSU97433.1 ferredoxin-type protein NapF [Photobacterium kishitanii]
MINRSRRGLFTRQRPSQQQRLPWIKDENTFTDQCQRCNACVDVCQTKVIVKGDGGFPMVDFHHGEGECSFCYQCAHVCPEPLFEPQQQPPWQQTVTINASCIALNNIECRSCGDQCETQAINFVLQVGKVAQPMINDAACSGCGACISGCPVAAIEMIAPAV